MRHRLLETPFRERTDYCYKDKYTRAALLRLGEDLRNLRLSSSQKLDIVFGGLDIDPWIDKETTKESEQEEEPTRRARTRPSLGKEAYQKIIETLEKSPEVRDISPMFTVDSSFLNPVVFEIHLPPSLQTIARRLPWGSKTEDFVVVYDGGLVMIGGICSRNQHVGAGSDVRDRLIALLKPQFPNLLGIPPFVTPSAISVVNTPLDKSEEEASPNTYVSLGDETIDECLRRVYLAMCVGMHDFYGACAIAKEATDIALKIQKRQDDLLNTCKEFLGTTWTGFLRRRELVRKMKRFIIEIFTYLTEYTLEGYGIREVQILTEREKMRNTLFRNFVDRLWDYTSPEAIDRESIMATIEHVRREGEAFSSFMSNLTSALLGGVIGSILTIAASFLLGVK